MLDISFSMAYTRPVTALVEKKNAMRKKLRQKSGFQFHLFSGLYSNTHSLVCGIFELSFLGVESEHKILYNVKKPGSTPHAFLS